VLDTSGNIVEKTLGAAGGAATSRIIGDVTRLPLIRETRNTAGQTVRRVRDTTGKTIEYVVGTAGRVTGVRVVQ
jgi:hypothetical protein